MAEKEAGRDRLCLSLPDGTELEIDPEPLMEVSVAQARSMLTMYPETCMWTSFILELQRGERSVVLHDYAYFAEYDLSNAKLHVRPTVYDKRGARLHLRRVRHILCHGIPMARTLTSGGDEDAGAATAAGTAAASATQAAAAPPPPPGSAMRLHKLPKEFTAQSATGDGGSDASTLSSASSLGASGGMVNALLRSQIVQKEAEAALPMLTLPVQADLTAFHTVSGGCPGTSIGGGSVANPKLPPCLRYVTFSGYNPPPSLRAAVGDLMYIDVETLEGSYLCITCTTHGFFINSTQSGGPLSPEPANSHFAANLIDLLRAVSPTFASGFKALLEASTSGRIEGRVPCLPSAQDDNMMHPATAPWRGRLLDRNSYPGFRTHGHGTVPAFNGALSSIGSGLAFSTMPWLVPPPDSFGEGHGFDPQRAEDDLTSSYGMDERGTLREWNEELQACFEFPTSTAEERAMRSRGQHKVLVDFVEAAAQGAMAIKHGHVLPLNPGDFHGQRVYVFNNIFFSMALNRYQKQREAEARLQLSEADTEGTGLASMLGSSEGGGGAARAGGDMAAAVKWDVPPEAASVSDSNHDLRMLKVVNACGVPGLHTLATTLVNIGGLRFVAQSIIPGIMQGEHASSLVYGSVTNGITIVSDPEMHGLMRTLCDRLHVAERIVRPLASDMLPEGSEPMHSMKPVPLVGPVECKGIVGSDGRRYLLDLGRLSPPDRHFYIRDDTLRYTLWFDDGSPQSVLQPSDYWPDPPKELASPDTRMRCLPSVLPQNETGYVALYRPELVQAFARHWAEEARKEGQSEPPPLALNVNLITRFQDRCTDTAGEPCAEADGEVLVKLQSFYHDVALPRAFKELCAAVTHITDGAALTTFLHARGVNMRHMGILHTMAVEGEARGDVPLVVRELLEVEMVSRMVRRKLHHFLASTGRDLLPPAYATALFLNAVLGAPDGKGPQHLHKGGIPASPSLPKAWRKSIASFLAEAEAGSPPQFCPPHILGVIDADRQFMRPMLLWSWIRREIESHFKTRLSLFWESGGYSSVLKRPNTDCSFKHWWKYTDDDGSSHPPPPVPSITCFERCHRPALLRRIAQKAGLQLAALPIDWTRANPITLEHIVGLVPVVKHCLPSPISPDAQALMVQARSLMAQRKYEEALAKANDAFGVLYIVVGVAHPDTAQCCSLQALILWHLKDRAGAVACQRQAVTLYEQLLGLDASETIRAHDTLAAVLAGAGMLSQAIHHYHRVLYLLEMVVGPRHPMSVATYVRVGMLAHDARHSNLALQSFSVAQSRCADDAQAAACAHATAMTWSARSNFRKAVEAEKTALRIHQARGEEGAKAAQAAEQWIRKFTEKAVALQKELAAMSAMGSAAAALATALQESATDTAASPSPAPKQDLPAVQALPVSKSQPVARIGTRWKPRRSRKKRK